MNGAQPGELRLGFGMDEWATCRIGDLESIEDAGQLPTPYLNLSS
jgi:hypothetical protein